MLRKACRKSADVVADLSIKVAEGKTETFGHAIDLRKQL